MNYGPGDVRLIGVKDFSATTAATAIATPGIIEDTVGFATAGGDIGIVYRSMQIDEPGGEEEGLGIAVMSERLPLVVAIAWNVETAKKVVNAMSERIAAAERNNAKAAPS